MLHIVYYNKLLVNLIKAFVLINNGATKRGFIKSNFSYKVAVSRAFTKSGNVVITTCIERERKCFVSLKMLTVIFMVRFEIKKTLRCRCRLRRTVFLLLLHTTDTANLSSS